MTEALKKYKIRSLTVTFARTYFSVCPRNEIINSISELLVRQL